MVASKFLIKQLTVVCQPFQKSQADNLSDARANDASDAQADDTSDATKRRRRRRVKELPYKGGLIEVLADDDPRKPEWPVVEYVRSASVLLLGLIIPSVIAVHGLGSKYPKTWMKDDTLWLEDFLPDDLPQARILAFIYPSEAFNDPDFVDLRTLGGSLLRSLVKDREGLSSKVSSVYFAPNR
jgi:hypothetical protein